MRKTNHTFMKFTSILLCFVMLLVFMPQAILAEAGELLNGGETPEYALTEDEQAPEAYVLGEMTDERTPNTKTFRMSDGSFVLADYNEPVHFEDENGELVDYDNTLTYIDATKDEEDFAGYETVDAKLADDPFFAAKGSAVLKYVDSKPFAESRHIKRLAEEEELNTYVFKNEDGTKSVYFLSEAVKYIDKNGMIREKDNTLVKTERGYSVKENEFDLNIPVNPQDGITLNYLDIPVKITPLYDNDNINGVEYGGSVIYKNIFDRGVSLKYTPVLSGVKEDIILERYDNCEYSFELNTGGLFVVELDDYYYLIDDVKNTSSEKAMLNLGDVVVYDAIGRLSKGKMTVKTIEEGNRYIITVCADPGFLADEETVYPVTIDPTITISDNNNGAGAIEDTILFSGIPNSNFANYIFLTAGYTDDLYKIGRVAIRLPGLYNSSAYTSVSANNISSVTLHCHDASGNPTKRVDLYRMTAAWTETSATWNTVGNSYSTSTNWGNDMPHSDWTVFDITTLVKGWKNGTYNASYGLMLVNRDEVTQANKKAPFSSEYANNTSYRPYVKMTYSIDTSSVVSLNRTQTKVNEGQTTTLAATTTPSGLTVSWSSSNTAVATVNQSGVISGIRAGSATITASCVYGGVSCQAQCTVYVTVPDGIYDMVNRNSNKYLTNSRGVTNGTVNVFQTTAYSATEQNVHEWVRQLWRIRYISDGKYSIRPYNMLARALDVTSGNVDTWKSTSTVNDNNLPYCALWTIEYGASTGTYIFKNNGDSNKTMQVQNASTSSNARVIVGNYSANNNCRWRLEKYSNPPVGMYLFDTASESVVADTHAGTTAPVQYVAPQETRTPLVPVQYSNYTIEQTFTCTSSNTSKATVNASAAVTGVAPSTSPIIIRFRRYLGASNGAYEIISYQLIITHIPNGTYFLKNKASKKYADIEDGNVSAGTQILHWEYMGGNTQHWYFTHLGNGYYSIKSANSSSSYYMGVENDGTATDTPVVLRTGTLTDGMKWKIDKTTSGAYKITPKTGEANNRVLAVGFYVMPNNGTPIKQRDYVNDTNYKDEWLIRKINTQLETPLLPQQTNSWCWAASAQMLARTITPTGANNGNTSLILSEQREAVYYVFGDLTATFSTYNWNTDPQNLKSAAGYYYHVGMAAAHLVGKAGGSATISAYATPYSEDALIEFLSDGYPIVRLYGWITFSLTPPVAIDDLKSILEIFNPNIGGHATVIKGVRWSDLADCFLFTVFDPWNGGSQEEMTYNELLFTIENTTSNNYKATLWFPTVVYKTDYSSKTFLEEIVGLDYNS